MNNIDYFKQDISVGDIATVELTSGKSVTGEVIEISDCVVIRKEDGKKMRLLDGIIGGWELVSQSKDSPQTESVVTPHEENHPNVSPTKPTSDDSSKKSDYGLKIVGKIDLSQFDKSKKSSGKVQTKVSGSVPSQNVSAPATNKTRMKSLGKGLEALEKIDKSSLSQTPKLSLTPLGRITRMDASSGFIFDTASQSAIGFEKKDFIGEASEFSLKDQVVYTIGPNKRGILQAIKILNVLSVDELISLAKNFLDNDEGSGRKKAKAILNYIQKEFPRHAEAAQLREKHFGIEPLDGDVVKPDIVISPDTIKALPLSFPLMSDFECKEKERELFGNGIFH